MPKIKSRPKRWEAAAAAAQVAFEEMRESLEEIKSLQEEYEEWKDGLPENLWDSPVAQKLEDVCEIDVDYPLQDMEETLNNLLDADLPRGFGRD